MQTESQKDCGCTGGCRARRGVKIPGCIAERCEQRILQGSTVHTHPENDGPSKPTDQSPVKHVA